MIQQGREQDPGAAGAGLRGPYRYLDMYRDLDHIPPFQNDHLLHRMGELLRLREDQRQRQRAIRRREQLALQEVRLREIGLPGVAPAAAGPPAIPPGPPPVEAVPYHPFLNPLPLFNFYHRPAVHFPPPPPPAHRQGPPRAVPLPPPAHPGIPRPAHAAPQPPPLPLNFVPQAPDAVPNRFQFEPLPLRRQGQPDPGAVQQGHAPQPRRSPDVIQHELDVLFNN